MAGSNIVIKEANSIFQMVMAVCSVIGGIIGVYYRLKYVVSKTADRIDKCEEVVEKLKVDTEKAFTEIKGILSKELENRSKEIREAYEIMRQGLDKDQTVYNKTIDDIKKDYDKLEILTNNIGTIITKTATKLDEHLKNHK